MMHDLRLLLCLRLRHVRTQMVRASHIVGIDPVADRGFSERAMQLYSALVILVVLLLLWWWLIDVAVTVFAALTAAGAALVLAVALAMPALLFMMQGLGGLRASLLKFSHPDIAFVAGSALGTRALVADQLTVSALSGGAFAVGVGYLLGVGLEVSLSAPVDPLAVALLFALLVMMAIEGAWLVSAVRLAYACGKRRWARIAVLAVGVVAVAGAFIALAFAVVPSVVAGPLGLEFGGVAPLCVAALLLMVALAWCLLWLVPRIDMITVVSENALYADMQPFGAMSLLDRGTIADYRRRRKLAYRVPRFHLMAAQGSCALVARAWLSFLRQREGIPALLMLGAVATPLGVCSLLSTGSPAMLMTRLVLLVAFPQGLREATRVFRDDMRIRLVRDQLPFDTLQLLVGDSLPSFAVVALASCVVVVFVLPAGASLPVALLLALLLNAATILCSGLDAVRLYENGSCLWSEIGLVVLVGVAAVFSFVGLPLLILVGVVAVVVIVAAILHYGVETVQ